jgi:hypothetical protein
VRYAIALAALFFAGAAHAQLSPDKTGPDALKNANILRWAKGEYEYRTLKAQTPRGSESFHLTVARDGSRTMRATTDISARDVQANVILRVAENFRPLDAYIALFTKGGYKGALTLNVDGDTLRALTTGPSGRIEQTTKVPAQFSFVTHPLALDSWHPWYIAPTKGIVQTGAQYFLNTDGDIAKALDGQMQPVTFEYMGEDEVRVPAGTFKATHVRMAGHSDIWFIGPDRLLVRYVWTEIDRDYVLKTLQTGP